MTRLSEERRRSRSVTPSGSTRATEDEYANWDITVPLDPPIDPPSTESTRATKAREHTEDPSVLTVDELAALLRVNRKTVYDALARGDIPGARRIGTSYRILRDAVLQWLASSQGRVSRSRSHR
jgi:excisionase family DNA binding protein